MDKVIFAFKESKVAPDKHGIQCQAWRKLLTQNNGWSLMEAIPRHQVQPLIDQFYLETL